jgi:hypothetical protein
MKGMNNADGDTFDLFSHIRSYFANQRLQSAVRQPENPKSDTAKANRRA